jgi:hypothetical protein
MKLSKTKLRWLVIVLCAVAAIRVFVFAAAFPFFNNVDEQAHVDLVVKYSHGQVPRGIETFASEAALYVVVYSTPEYLLLPNQLVGEYRAPAWTFPPEELRNMINSEVPAWEVIINYESGEPPLYYALAGGWMNLGRAFGLRGLTLLYWIRFLNIPFAIVLVWLGYKAGRILFPEQQFAGVTVATLLAVWPQTSFYSIQSDSLSPITFGIAFVGLMKLSRAERPNICIAAWIGLSVAASCLVKTANLPLVFISATAVIFKSVQLTRTGTWQRGLSIFAVFAISCALPLGIWFAWNLNHFGDLTATASKIRLLQWTRKPFGEWWSHELFTWQGLLEFWPDLIKSFWRGEFIWYTKRLASPFVDAIYVIITTVVVLATVWLLLRRRVKLGHQRFIIWFALLSFLSLVVFLAMLSISFDFGNCPYPSRDYPFLTSGRFLNATLIPFLLLFVVAIDHAGNCIKRTWARWALLTATALFLIVSQAQVNAPAFASRYNFFHRPTTQ